MFGGLGFNLFNPALIGRAFMLATFPLAMTLGWSPPRVGARAPARRGHDGDAAGGAARERRRRGDAAGRRPGEPWAGLVLGFRPGSASARSRCCWSRSAAPCCVARGIIGLTIPLGVFAGVVAHAPRSSGAPLLHLLSRRPVAGRVLHGDRLRHLARTARRADRLRARHRRADRRHPPVRRLSRGHLLRDPARQHAGAGAQPAGSARGARRSRRRGRRHEQPAPRASWSRIALSLTVVCAVGAAVLGGVYVAHRALSRARPRARPSARALTDLLGLGAGRPRARGPPGVRARRAARCTTARRRSRAAATTHLVFTLDGALAAREVAPAASPARPPTPSARPRAAGPPVRRPARRPPVRASRSRARPPGYKTRIRFLVALDDSFAMRGRARDRARGGSRAGRRDRDRRGSAASSWAATPASLEAST